MLLRLVFSRTVDDFTVANKIRDLIEQTGNIVGAALAYTWDGYINGQGTFSTYILLGLLLPLNGAGLVRLRAIFYL